ncbi:MAG: hypothetical protein LBI11_03630 [Streptococcaceae bacterium]|jgi:hypothetical protein|nr:hypothetical protein [Streptococcaceae bacterium]
MVDVTKMNPWPLFGLFVATLIVAYAIAYWARNDYDIRKIWKPYLIYAAPLVVFDIIFWIPWILAAGCYLFGAIILVFRNQHYFDC